MTEKAKLEPWDSEIQTCGTDFKAEGEAEDEVVDLTDELQKGKTVQRASQCICNTVFQTGQVDDVAGEPTDAGEVSLLTSRPGWSCSE